MAHSIRWMTLSCMIGCVLWLAESARLRSQEANNDLGQELKQARILSQKYQFGEAGNHYQKAVNWGLLLYGPKDPRAAALMTEAASVLREHGIFKRAEDLLRNSVSIQEKVLGPDHLDTAKTLRELAFLYYEMGQAAQGSAAGRACRENSRSQAWQGRPRDDRCRACSRQPADHGPPL